MDAAFSRITVDELRQRMASGEHVVLVDARSDNAFASSDRTIPGSVRVPPSHLDETIGAVPRDADLIVAWCT